MRGDQQQDQDEEIERGRGGKKCEEGESDRICGRPDQRQARAKLTGPDRHLTVAQQPADQRPARQLAVENVRRKIVVGYINDAERQEPPVRQEGPEGQEGARRQSGTQSAAHIAASDHGRAPAGNREDSKAAKPNRRGIRLTL